MFYDGTAFGRALAALEAGGSRRGGRKSSEQALTDERNGPRPRWPPSASGRKRRRRSATRAKGEAAAREAAEREAKAQAERDRLSKEQAEKDRLEREAAEKAERERAEKERAEREAREAAAREALAKAAQSGDAPDFDLLIRNAVDAKLANLEASMRADLTDQMDR